MRAVQDALWMLPAHVVRMIAQFMGFLFDDSNFDPNYPFRLLLPRVPEASRQRGFARWTRQ